MFRSRTKAPQHKKVDTIIGKDTGNGQMDVRGSIRFDGCFDGTINADGDVAVGEGAKLKVTIHAFNIMIAGEVEGDIYASGMLEIASTGVLHGNVKVGSLRIEDGAIFRGSCEMLEEGDPPKLLPGEVYDIAIQHSDLDEE